MHYFVRKCRKRYNCAIFLQLAYQVIHKVERFKGELTTLLSGRSHKESIRFP